ncbi:MAG: FAD:protein FMN transferase [Methylococcales bacterium]
MRHIIGVTALFISLMLTGCFQSKDIQTIEGSTQGTTYHVSWWSTEAVDPDDLKIFVDRELARIDAQISNYRPDSTIEKFNHHETTAAQDVSSEINYLINTANKVSKASDGCYDLTIKPLFDLWGFNGDDFTPPDQASLATALAKVGMDKLQVQGTQQLRKSRPKLQVDLSSIGQGYSVARIAELLEQHNITDYLVEIGGELQTRGQKPDNTHWHIAVERPLIGKRSLQKLVIVNRLEPLAIMTSGTYRHYFDHEGKRYSHILDARTGRPIEHNTVSVTVFLDNPTEADAWSTAFICMGREKGLEVANHLGIAALFIDQVGDDLKEFPSERYGHIEGVEIK